MGWIVILGAVASIVARTLARAGYGLAEDSKVHRRLRGRRVLPPAALADGASGTVHGAVAAIADDAVVTSPVTRQSCVFWRVVVDEVGANDFVELGREEQGVPFLVVTDDGVARVVPDHAQLDVARYVLGVDRRDRRSSLGALAARIGRPPRHRSTQIRITEHVIAHGIAATVSGSVTHEPDPDATTVRAGYRAEASTRPVLSGTRRAPLLVRQR